MTFRHSIDERIEGARAVGAHKTSMLQDVENGRPMELDALVLSVLELAALTARDVANANPKEPAWGPQSARGTSPTR